MNQNGEYRISALDYVEENVSTKVIEIIKSYIGGIKWCEKIKFTV